MNTINPSNQFFVLKKSLDPEIVGPELTQLTLYGERPKIFKTKSDLQFGDYNIPLRFSLLHKAKWTDFLSQPSLGEIGITISSTSKNSLEGFDLNGHRFYPASFHLKDGEFKERGYWLALSKFESLNYIDFDLSEFTIINMINSRVKSSVNIVSPSDFIKKQQQLHFLYRIAAKTLKFKKEIDVDIFFMFPCMKYFISRKLADKLILDQLTGFTIEGAQVRSVPKSR